MNKTRKHIHPKAMSDSSFDKPRDIWNVFKIISEIVEGYESLSHVKPAVSIFGSARTPKDGKVFKLTEEIAYKLSVEGYNIITGGGPGVMEAANIGASKGPSLSIGLNIDLPHEQSSNGHQDIMLRYRYFFTRKVMFIKHSMAYIAMPGGFGTLDELFDIATLIQTQKKRAMPIILVGSEFWGGLIDWIKDTMIKNKTINLGDPGLLSVVDTADEVVEIINCHNDEQCRHKFDKGGPHFEF